MPDQVLVRIEGLTQLVRNLEALGVSMDDMKDAMAKIADFGAMEAQRAAPVKTGRLRSDIRGNRAKSKAVVAAGRASVPYAGPINYGWPKRGIAPRLFMQAADGPWQSYGLRVLEQELNRLIRQRGLA